MKSSTPRPRGRPRSALAGRAILDAAISLLRQHGYARFSIERVAELAGVGKPTLYRRWPTKPALILDAFRQLSLDASPIPDTGNIERDLVSYVCRVFRAITLEPDGSGFAGLLAELQVSDDTRSQFHAYLDERREPARRILRRAVQRGELPAGFDLELTLDLIYGPLWTRLLFGRGRVTEKIARPLIHAVLRGVESL